MSFQLNGRAIQGKKRVRNVCSLDSVRRMRVMPLIYAYCVLSLFVFSEYSLFPDANSLYNLSLDYEFFATDFVSGFRAAKTV